MVVLREARESLVWLRLIAACYPELKSDCAGLTREADELVSIFTTSTKTVKASLKRRR